MRLGARFLERAEQQAMLGAKVSLDRLEKLSLFVIANRAPRDIDNPGIGDDVSPRPPPI